MIAHIGTVVRKAVASVAMAACALLFVATAADAAQQMEMDHVVGTGGANAFGQTVWYLTLHSPYYLTRPSASSQWQFLSWGSPYLTVKTTPGWSVSDKEAGWDTTGYWSRWSHGSATFKYLNMPWVGALQTKYPRLVAYTEHK